MFACFEILFVLRVLCVAVGILAARLISRFCNVRCRIVVLCGFCLTL